MENQRKYKYKLTNGYVGVGVVVCVKEKYIAETPTSQRESFPRKVEKNRYLLG